MHGISNTAAYRNRGIFIESINSAAFLDINTEIIRLQTFCRKSKKWYYTVRPSLRDSRTPLHCVQKKIDALVYFFLHLHQMYTDQTFFGKPLLKTRPKEQN